MKDIILPEQLRIPCFLENVSDSDHEWAGARRGFRFLLGTRSSIAHIHVGMYSFGPGGCWFSSDQALRSTELYDTVPEGASSEEWSTQQQVSEERIDIDFRGIGEDSAVSHCLSPLPPDS